MMMIRWDESMRRWIWEEVNLLLSWFNVVQGGSRWWLLVEKTLGVQGYQTVGGA